MENEDEKFENFLENVSVIILRKIDFFNIYMKNLADEAGKEVAGRVEPDILKIISSMEPEYFLSKRELELGSIIASTELSDIDRNKIGEMISKSLHL